MVNLVVRRAALAELVSPESPLERIADGFLFTEGPVWHPSEGHLTFSDIPASIIYRWDEESGLRVWRENTGKANGNAYDASGRLISCEHATSRVVRHEPDGSVTVLAESFQGKELNSPNDVIVGRDGAVYFTDPVYGRTNPVVGLLRDPELEVRGVYRVVPGEEPELLIGDCEGPNGLCFSEDERRLFVNDSDRGVIRCFDWDGVSARGGAVWAEPTGTGPGAVDGMKVDSLGNLYCTGPGGVFVYTPEAELLGVIEVPELVGNFVWGGADLRTLFLCASTSVYACRTAVAGIAAFSSSGSQGV
ncbi:MAG: gluconolactonase [Naasia sp.]|jgi:gluconolactonase|uniref:SMP-30/gluconolactonase/LRE family protein n=1 Tax=Naasia sp. TaxID=2546198 RepID=UPI002607E2CB|nr:SMP-30/gluconolactonase/LRE family protein [Naasia sp.]MCU1569442.1 gluconolactonase [Naasia sp.]